MPDGGIFLGMPGYGDLTAGAARGFWRATRRPDSEVRYQYNHGSLLANNFNQLWCSALNHCLDGWPVRYFAMQHADIEPQDWWLDTLIDALDASGLDVLGVAVPIKSPTEGLTSLALARPDGSTWRPLCRLTLDEVYSLPNPFTSADLGHPLLINTGLWVCRFDPSWASLVKFTINDRIVQTPNGRYAPEVEPEDWYASRLFHELGLKVGATRQIALTHRGPAAFPNSKTWGEPFDSAYVDKSQLRTVERDGFRFPADVDGWLTFDEGRALFDLARGKRVLEIGSYCGRSTICLAQSARSVVAVDPHDGRGTPRVKDTLETFGRNTIRHGFNGQITPVVGTIADAPGGPFDLAFIDGSHDCHAVRNDIAGSLERLAPGGLLAFHDYKRDPGVTRAVNELGAAGAELISHVGTLAVVRPPAAIPLEV